MLAVNDWAAVVFDSKTQRFGCVFIHAGNVRCRCRSHRGACPFITAFNSSLHSDDTLQPLKANLLHHEEVTITERSSVSWKPIPMATSRYSLIHNNK